MTKEKKLKKCFSALFLIVACSTAMAQSENWMKISSSDLTDYYVLKRSGFIQKNKAGEEVIVMTGKQENKVTKTITLEKIYVRTQHCQAEQGLLVAVDMDGNFKDEYNFIFGAGSVGTSKAEFACGIAKAIKDQDDKKGL